MFFLSKSADSDVYLTIISLNMCFANLCRIDTERGHAKFGAGIGFRLRNIRVFGGGGGKGLLRILHRDVVN